MTRASKVVLTTAAAIGIATAGAGAGAGLFASLDSPTTTTVVSVDGAEPVSTSGGLTINQIYERTNDGVVDITIQGSSGTAPFGGAQAAEGSGFVYDKQGHIITNQHVVSSGGSITVRFSNGKTYSATLVGSDASTDLAVIKVSAPSSALHPLTLGDSSKVEVGDGVVAIGSPFGLTGTVTSGIVSALHRRMESPSRYTINDSIQTDAAINHGNSGGPLIDMLGRVIGVNTQIQSDSGGNDGVGFAIPSNTVKKVVSQVAAGKTPQHAYMGISVTTSTSPAGAGLAEVVSGTPADRAGLQAGDVITKLDSTEVQSADDLSSVIDGKKPGDEMKVTYVRNGSTRTVTLTLGTRPS